MDNCEKEVNKMNSPLTLAYSVLLFSNEKVAVFIIYTLINYLSRILLEICFKVFVDNGK